MENNLSNNLAEKELTAKSNAIAKSFLSNVFTYMAAALGITGLIAYLFGTDINLLTMLYHVENGILTKPNILGYIVMFAPFGFVLLMSGGFQRFSSLTLSVLFVVFAILMGMSLSTVFLIYTGTSIFSTFAVTSGTFAIMAVLGYTTKTDLTKFGSILMMGLIGIILASIVNMFVGNGTMELIISVLGVLIFTGLTAYDVQKLKRIGSGVEYGTDTTNKLAIMGDLSLYLDFMLGCSLHLRFLGDRK